MSDIQRKKQIQAISGAVMSFFNKNKEVVLPDMLEELANQILDNLEVTMKTSGKIIVTDNRK